jgi:hypothetical protein
MQYGNCLPIRRSCHIGAALCDLRPENRSGFCEGDPAKSGSKPVGEYERAAVHHREDYRHGVEAGVASAQGIKAGEVCRNVETTRPVFGAHSNNIRPTSPEAAAGRYPCRRKGRHLPLQLLLSDPLQT